MYEVDKNPFKKYFYFCLLSEPIKCRMVSIVEFLYLAPQHENVGAFFWQKFTNEGRQMNEFYFYMGCLGIVVACGAYCVHVVAARMCELEKQMSDIQRHLIQSNNDKEIAQASFQAEVLGMFKQLQADNAAMHEKLNGRIDNLYGVISKA